MNIHVVSECYRGFRMGWTMGPHGFKAAWKSSLETEWTISCVYAKSNTDAIVLAKQCIDFRYKSDAVEANLCRKLTTQEIIEIGKGLR